uniref:SGNH domain-containing protein n=1 Tax=Panagrolaimus sp. PS1159 TaxID=55785 RepID=A0AC35GAQ8_9BILA
MLINFGHIGNAFTFGMLPTRIWQFSAGFCVYYALNFFDEFPNCNIFILLFKFLRHSIFTNVLSALLLTITLFPTILDQAYAQICTIILTSILIAGIGRQKEKEELQFSILSNRFIVFIGDASYSLYISHWIFVTFSNILFEHSETNRRFLLCLCLIIGIIVHRWIEKPIVKAKYKPKEFLSILFFVYIVIILGILTMNSSTPQNTSSFIKEIYHNKSKFIANETQWSQISATISPGLSAKMAIYSSNFGCKHFPLSNFSKSFYTPQQPNIRGAELKGHGNLSVLVIGNSHAECFFPSSKLVLDGMYSELNLFVTGGATPFEGFAYSQTGNLLKDAVIHYKPDIIFLVFKYQPDMDFPPTEPISTDIGTIKMQEMINFLTNNSKVLLISDIHFESFRFNSLIFAEAMHFNGWVGNYQFPESDLKNRHIISAQRWKEIKCKNCIFMNFLQAFCKENWCSPVDVTGKVSLITDDNHLSAFGSYLLAPFLRGYIEKMNEILKIRDFNRI